MFKKILIANRGEIAVRIIRACKELEIISASVYSEVDKYALHTRLADESHFIGESLPSESYLNQNKIIELAKEINADAIHPGYGFLSENASFIKKVEESGIVFIGPSSRSVEMMGSKTAARELMKRNGVPIVPGTTEKISSLDSAKKNAKEIGYPILLKASAGGGGKGHQPGAGRKGDADGEAGMRVAAGAHRVWEDHAVEPGMDHPVAGT